MTAMLAVYDTMQFVRAPVATTCVGQAASTAAVLLAAGAAGRRSILPHARVLLHQPSARSQGAIPDLILEADEVIRLRAEAEQILAHHTGQPLEMLRADTDRDRIFTPQAAVAYGLVDSLLGYRTARPEGCLGCEQLRVVPARGGGSRSVRPAGRTVGEVQDPAAERARDGGKHLRGRVLPAALDLGEVLR